MGLFIMFFLGVGLVIIPDISHHDPSSMSSGCLSIFQKCCANVKVHISHRLMIILKRDDYEKEITLKKDGMNYVRVM